MNLTVRINGIEYKNCVAQGITFSEEFNETLDSCVVRISNVPRITGIEPYDDVYIYDTDNFDFDNDVPILRTTDWGQYPNGRTFSNGQVWTEAQAGQYSDNPFYRHFLLDQFTETIVRLGATREDNICDYTLELFSETKRLEKVQLPNLSITQPLNARKRKSVWEYLNIYLGLYSPKIKVVDDAQAQTWKYALKYTLSASLQDVFGDIYCPEFTLSNPTLRDIFSQLMIVADCIPYVRDDIIYSMDISKRGASFSITDEMANGRVNYITSSKTSDDYCDGVRRQYSQALAENGVCEFVENLGFRNKDKALVSMADLQVETSHNIYKINKMYLCYYRNVEVSIDGGTATPAQILIRQDITPLVKLQSEWEYLSQDWGALTQENVDTIYQLAKYKLATVYYQQGGNIIGGWGRSYQQIAQESTILNTFVITKTYIENIVRTLDIINPYGVDGIMFYRDQFKTVETQSVSIRLSSYGDTSFNFIYNPNATGITGSSASDPWASNIAKLKSVFFNISYSGFYDGALVHSRDEGRDQIIANDNSSSSLALLEKDGVNQKEKLNRFANKTYQIQGKLRSIDNLIGLSQTTTIGEDDDVIVYKREYSIYDNDIAVNYLAIQNYVLRDYFVSVYSKYRTYQLMSYGESISRAETRKQFYLLSTEKKYADGDIDGVPFLVAPNTMFSAFVPSEQQDQNYIGGIYVKSHQLQIATGDFIYNLMFNVSTTDEEVLNFFEACSFAQGAITSSIITFANVNSYVVAIKNRDETNVEVNGFYKLIISSNGTSTTILTYDPRLDGQKHTWKNLNIEDGFGTFQINEKVDDILVPALYNGSLIGQSGEGAYLLDINAFTSGKMVCFNMKMRDNISGGSYIRKWTSRYGILFSNPSQDPNYTVGTEQGWYDIVDDDETGKIKEMLWFALSGISFPATNPSTVSPNPVDLIERYPRFNEVLPFLVLSDNFGIIYEDEQIYKDNKEKVDKTYQLEPYTDDKNIVIGEWFSKLNNLIGGYKKVFSPTTSTITMEVTEFQANTTFDLYDGVTSMLNYGLYLELSDTDLLQYLSTLEPIVFKINTSWDTGFTRWPHAELHYNGIEAVFDGDKLTIIGSGFCVLTRTQSFFTDIITVNYGNLEFSIQPVWNNHYVCTLYGTPFENQSQNPHGKFKMYGYTGVENEISKNCFIVTSNTPATSELCYVEPKWGDTDFEGTLENISVSDVFSSETTSSDRGGVVIRSSTITVSLENLPAKTEPYSIQYWYFDDKSAYIPNAYEETIDGVTYAVGTKYTYSPQRSAYHLVFAVNITQEDIDNGITKKVIYASMSTNRDTRVFNQETGAVIGELYNCIQNGIYQPPTGYTYTPVAQNQ